MAAEHLQPAVRHMTPGARITSLVHDARGFLWFGTEAGPVRYDGRTFSPLRPGSVPLQQVFAMLFDRKGDMWIGTRGANPLQRAKRGRAPEPVALRTPITEVLALAEQGTDVWLGTNRGLLVYRNNVIEETGVAELSSVRVSALLAARDGSLWIACDKAVLRLQQGRVVANFPGDGTALGQDSEGHVWVAYAGNAHVNVLNPEGRTLQSFRTFATNAFFADAGGAMWLATNQGLFRSLKMRAPEEVYLGRQYDTRLATVLRDIDGTLWIGTQSSGALQLDTQPAARVLASGLPDVDTFSFSVAQDNKQDLWVSGTSSLLRFNDKQIESHPYGPKTGLPYDLRALFPSQTGGIWGASRESGAFLISKAPSGALAVKRFAAAGTLTIYEDPSGKAWFGWSKGNLGRSTKGAAPELVPLPSNAVVSAIAPAHGGGFWLATDSGVLRLWPDDKVDLYGATAGLKSTQVFSLMEFANGVVCAGTAGGGLDCMSDDRFVHYGLSEGLTNDVVGSLVLDAQGVLWLGTASGILRLHQPPAPKQATLQARRVGLGSGLRSVECVHAMGPSGLVLADGAVVFSTTAGVAWLDPVKLAAQGAPAVVIDRIVLNGQTQEVEHGDWPVGGGNLEIHYAAPRFQRADALSFRYRLQGQDAAWVKADARQVAIYTNLRPGRYTFAVAVDDGNSHTEASTAFTLTPPLHRRLWFQLAAFLALGGLAFAIARRRATTARVRRADILAERTRLARELHDTVEQNVVSVRIQLDCALETLAPAEGDAKQYLQRAVDLLGRTSQGMRAAIHALRLPGNKPSDLGMAISNSAGRLLRNTDVAFELQLMGGPYYPGHLEHEQIIGIVDEALTNAIKHADAHKILVSVSRTKSHVVIEIADDGCGFDPSMFKEGHYGLHGMQERADLIGAALHLRSEIGKGTKVVLKLPANERKEGMRDG